MNELVEQSKTNSIKRCDDFS